MKSVIIDKKDHWWESTEDDWVQRTGIRKYYKTPCLEYLPLDSNSVQDIEEHEESCPICRVILGKSKAKVFDYSKCSKLWALGYPCRTPETKYNGSTLNGLDLSEIIHYFTLSAIRTDDGKIIANTEDWASGFATMPNFPRELIEASLPLTTLRDNRVNIYTIKIVDSESVEYRDHILFKAERYNHEDYFIYGIDESQRFVAVLPDGDQPTTVEEAYECLRPELVTEADVFGMEVQRQGDLFFIRDEGIKFSKERIQKQHYENVTYGWNKQTMKKKLKRPAIPVGNGRTRHEAMRLVESDNDVYVMGKIFHPEHRTLELGDTWYQVVGNTAQESWSIRGRGGYGVD